MTDGPNSTSEPGPEPVPETRHDRATRRAATRRRRLIALGAVIVVAVVAVGAVLLLSGDDSDDGRGNQAAGTTAPGGEANGSEETATTSAPTTTTNDRQPLPTGVCRVGQLTANRALAGLTGQTQTAVIALANASENSCTLNGVPGLTITGADGDQPTVVSPGGGAVPPELVAQPVTLEPGAQASFFMSWVPVAGPGSGDAGCSKGDALKVAPPESNGDVRAEMRITACFGGSINVSPIQPGVIPG
jgi:hypothetical protein